MKTFNARPGRRIPSIFDDEQTGLAVRLTKSAQKGSLSGKSFLAQFTVVGQKRRIPLGPCTGIKLAAARDAVKVILGDVAKGRDPAAERKAATWEAKRRAVDEDLTLSALVSQWQTLHLADRRERYAAEAVRALRFAFAKRLGSPASRLDRSAVVRVLDGLTKDGKAAMASRTTAYGRACYHWAVKRGSLSANPFQDLPLTPIAKRERFLDDGELRSVWQATESPGTFNSIVRTLILTGQRREEVAGMTWDEIAPDLLMWTIPASRAKNGKSHIVPLSTQAHAIVKAAPRRAKDAGEKDDDEPELIFRGQRAVFNGFSKAKATLDKESGVKDWRLHDLRRTMATGLQRLGVRLEVVEAILNHVGGSRAGIVGIYQRHEWADEKRVALGAWGAHVAAIVEKRESPDNVSPLRRSGSVRLAQRL